MHWWSCPIVNHKICSARIFTLKLKIQTNSRYLYLLFVVCRIEDEKNLKTSATPGTSFPNIQFTLSISFRCVRFLPIFQNRCCSLNTDLNICRWNRFQLRNCRVIHHVFKLLVVVRIQKSIFEAFLPLNDNFIITIFILLPTGSIFTLTMTITRNFDLFCSSKIWLRLVVMKKIVCINKNWLLILPAYYQLNFTIISIIAVKRI